MYNSSKISKFVQNCTLFLFYLKAFNLSKDVKSQLKVFDEQTGTCAMVHKKICNSSSIAGIFYHSRSRCTFREAGVGDCFSVAGVVKQGKIYLSCHNVFIKRSSSCSVMTLIERREWRLITLKTLIISFSWWWLATLNLNIDYIFLIVLIIATMHLFDTKFLYFNSGTCVLVHFHLVVPPSVNLTLVCKNSLRICEKKNSS